MKNPLLNNDFLKELDLTSLKEVYAEILSLNKNGEILESIEGRVSKGSLNVDGNSSVRRTCSLTIVANELNIHDFYWGLCTKFKLRIGLKNDINPEYPEIVWFDQGEFVISTFSTVQGLSNYTINIQGKDKMTLLNGDLGGTITSLTWDFGMVEVTDDYGNAVDEKVLIKDIIIGAVHQFANDPLYKIIVNDLDDRALELLEYRGKEPMYVFIDENSTEVLGFTLDGNTKIEINGQTVPVSDSSIIYNPMFELDVKREYSIIQWGDKNCSIAKIEYGMTAGYRQTDLVFPDELIMSAGQTVTMMLDKIVAFLGDYEYFYDIDGNFIFQQKKTFIDLSWNNIVHNEDETYVENSAYTSAVSYSFEDGIQIASYTNNPNFSELRNDFSVWGTRKGVTGANLPIHMRFAIDKKPYIYVNYEGKLYTTFSQEELEYFFKSLMTKNSIPEQSVLKAEWREVLYQMAQDYNRHHLKEDYYIKLYNNNFGLYPYGKTGYEQYYVDMNGFWRDIYSPKEDIKKYYEQVYLTKEEYLSNYENYYYKKSNFISDKNASYRFARTYYIEEVDEFGKKNKIPVKVASDEYNEAQQSANFPYFWIDPTTPYIYASCKIIEPYLGSGYIYYDKDGNQVKGVTENNYQQYYYLKDYSYESCVIPRPYESYKTYYRKNNNDTYDKYDKVTEEEYNSYPGKYYILVNDYTRCQVDSEFSTETEYFVKYFNKQTGEENYKSVSIDADTFNKNKTFYYYIANTNGEKIYKQCIDILKEDYDSTITYVSKDREILTVKNDENYQTFLLKGNIYQRIPVLEQSIHPKEYSTLLELFEYTEKTYSEEGWIPEVTSNPEALNFWIDFIDEDSELLKYGCQAIGNRPKAINDAQAKAIYFREAPTVIFVEADEPRNRLGYTYLQIPKDFNLFSVSRQGKTVKSVVDQLVYKHTCEIESITISTLPIYHLQPNSRIFVRNDESGINGEYIITKYTIALGTSNNISINASKAVDRIY